MSMWAVVPHWNPHEPSGAQSPVCFPSPHKEEPHPFMAPRVILASQQSGPPHLEAGLLIAATPVLVRAGAAILSHTG